MSLKRLINYRSSKKCQVTTRFIKIRKRKKKPLYEKKQINHKNTQSCQYRRNKQNGEEKQTEEIKISKDDSIRIFKAIKD